MDDGQDPRGGLAAGTRLGDYRLEEKLARGGMAEIWSARLEGGGPPLAVKVLLPQFSQDPTFRAMFRDEVAIATRLDHDNVIRVFGAHETAGHLFLAMELLDGKDLRRLLSLVAQHSERVPVPVALEIARQMALGLAHAHALTNDDGKCLDVVHRDVSPHNVMITRAGHVKMLDFGIARAAERLTRTRTGVIKGKVAYMAPEQALAVGVTPQTDIFAVGVVLWEMLAMKRLFRAESDAASIELVVRAEVPPIRSINGEVPPMAAELLQRMLALRAPDRPSSMADVADRLDRILNAAFGDRRPTAEHLSAWALHHLEVERADTIVVPADEVPVHVETTEPNAVVDETSTHDTPVTPPRPAADEDEIATLRPDPPPRGLADDTSGNTPVIVEDPTGEMTPPGRPVLPSFVVPAERTHEGLLGPRGASRAGGAASRPSSAPVGAGVDGPRTDPDPEERFASTDGRAAPTVGLMSGDPTAGAASTPEAKDTSSPTEAVRAIDVKTQAIRAQSVSPATPRDEDVRLPTKSEIIRAIDEQATVPVQADPRFAAPAPIVQVVTPAPPSAPSMSAEDTAAGSLAPRARSRTTPLALEDDSGAFVRIDPSVDRPPPPAAPPLAPVGERPPMWLPLATVVLGLVVVVLLFLVFYRD